MRFTPASKLWKSHTMAMNKKELASFEALKVQSLANRALRWSDYDNEPDMPVPKEVREYANGWSINIYTGTVYPTWSGVAIHGTREEGEIVDSDSRHSRGMGGSQNGIRQFSTKKRALMALRRALEHKFAEQLAAVDKNIADEADRLITAEGGAS